MMETTLKDILLEGSGILEDLVAGRLNYRAFLERYDSFYYRYGLDGFDAPDAWQSEFPKFSDLVDFYRLVQGVVDASYLNDPAADNHAYAEAGRISETEATERLIGLAKDFDLSAKIASLRDKT